MRDLDRLKTKKPRNFFENSPKIDLMRFCEGLGGLTPGFYSMGPIGSILCQKGAGALRVLVRQGEVGNGSGDRVHPLALHKRLSDLHPRAQVSLHTESQRSGQVLTGITDRPHLQITLPFIGDLPPSTFSSALESVSGEMGVPDVLLHEWLARFDPSPHCFVPTVTEFIGSYGGGADVNLYLEEYDAIGRTKVPRDLLARWHRTEDGRHHRAYPTGFSPDALGIHIIPKSGGESISLESKRKRLLEEVRESVTESQAAVLQGIDPNSHWGVLYYFYARSAREDYLKPLQRVLEGSLLQGAVTLFDFSEPDSRSPPMKDSRYLQPQVRYVPIGRVDQTLFRRFMMLADLPALVTGDLSLSEAVSFGKRFIYEQNHWKRWLVPALFRFAQDNLKPRLAERFLQLDTEGDAITAEERELFEEASRFYSQYASTLTALFNDNFYGDLDLLDRDCKNGTLAKKFLRLVNKGAVEEETDSEIERQLAKFGHPVFRAARVAYNGLPSSWLQRKRVDKQDIIPTDSEALLRLRRHLIFHFRRESERLDANRKRHSLGIFFDPVFEEVFAALGDAARAKLDLAANILTEVE